MNETEAQKLVEELILQKNSEFMLIPDTTEEYDSCFVFCYQGRKYVESGNMEGFYVGHGSVIVAKKTGVVYETGSAYPTEHYVKAFSACGDPFAELTVNVNVSGWREGANKVSTTKLIKKVSGLGLKEAKNVVDQALTGNPTSFSVSSVEEAKEVVIQIENYGFKCSQLWSTRPSSVMYKKQRKNYDLSI